jgi:hypothetical protein
MEQNHEAEPPAKLQRQDEFVDDENDYKELFEEGEVTGYMAHKLLPQDTSGINSFNVCCLLKIAFRWNILRELFYAILQHFSSPQATAGEKQGKFVCH